MKSALAFALLLAACNVEEPSSEEARNIASAPAPQALPAQPAPIPQAQSQGNTSASTSASLTAEGWGPLRIGMTLAEITRALGPDSDPDAVGGADPAQCDQFRPARAPRGLLVMVEQGRLTRISLINGVEIDTDKGIGLGDTRQQVVSAYGAAAVASPHKYSEAPAGYLDVWTGGGGGGGESFVASPAARGIRYEIDQADKVSAIHAGGPSIQYVEGCS